MQLSETVDTQLILFPPHTCRQEPTSEYHCTEHSVVLHYENTLRLTENQWFKYIYKVAGRQTEDKILFCPT